MRQPEAAQQLLEVARQRRRDGTPIVGTPIVGTPIVGTPIVGTPIVGTVSRVRVVRRSPRPR